MSYSSCICDVRIAPHAISLNFVLVLLITA